MLLQRHTFQDSVPWQAAPLFHKLCACFQPLLWADPRDTAVYQHRLPTLLYETTGSLYISSVPPGCAKLDNQIATTKRSVHTICH